MKFITERLAIVALGILIIVLGLISPQFTFKRLSLAILRNAMIDDEINESHV